MLEKMDRGVVEKVDTDCMPAYECKIPACPFLKSTRGILLLFYFCLIYSFGFLIENSTNRIIAPAPLFDHGNSLFNFAGADDLESDGALATYADTLVPCVYDDFIGTAKKVLTPEHREGLRHLLDFNFKKHSRYNLPPKRLALIEKQIRKRAIALLD